MSPEFDAALADLLAVAGHVRESDLGRPAPCAGWDVRRLLEHLIGWQRVFAACARDEAPPFDGESPTYSAGADLVADLRESAAELGRALDERGEVPVDLPYRGRTPVAAHVEELVAETVLHTWDLAVAVGARPDPSPDVLAIAQRGLTRLLGTSFGPVAFAEPGGDGPDEPDLAGLLARSGRVPDGPLTWTSAPMSARVDLEDRDAVLDLPDDEP